MYIYEQNTHGILLQNISAGLGLFWDNFPKKNPSETWTHPPTSTVEFLNFFTLQRLRPVVTTLGVSGTHLLCKCASYLHCMLQMPDLFIVMHAMFTVSMQNNKQRQIDIMSNLKIIQSLPKTSDFLCNNSRDPCLSKHGLV